MKKKQSKQYTLGTFINNEMEARKLSIREFAKLVGVSHTTLIKHIEHPETRPGLDLLEKLSNATGASLETLVKIVSPEFAAKSRLSPRVLLIAEKLNEFGEEAQEFFLSMTSSYKGRGNTK